MRKTIVQALGWYYPNSLGGTEAYVAGLCRHLQAANHVVRVAAPDPRNHTEREYLWQGVPVYRYPIETPLSRDESQNRVAARGSQRFHQWLKKQKPDVIHFHSLAPGLDLTEIIAARQTGAYIIATTHASGLGYICPRGTLMRWGDAVCDGIHETIKCASCLLQNCGMPKVIAPLFAVVSKPISEVGRLLPGGVGTAIGMTSLMEHYQQCQRELLAAVDKFVVLTKWGYDTVLANGAPPEKVVLNRLGYGQEDVNRKPGPDEHPTQLPLTVGYLGRFDPIKGVLDLATAIRSLDAALPLKFEFRGPLLNDADRRTLQEVKAIIGNDSRVTYSDAVDSSEVPAILADYDVLCCPSVCFEGGPTVAIEAYAVGTPVVGCSIGGLREIITDDVNGRLIAPGRPQELAQVLIKIAKDPGNTIDRWRKALPVARRMADVAADYLALYVRGASRGLDCGSLSEAPQ